MKVHTRANHLLSQSKCFLNSHQSGAFETKQQTEISQKNQMRAE